MNNNFSLGSRLRELRKERLLSQEQLAHLANITPAYLGQVERDVKHVTVHTLKKVCDALCIPLSEFFNDAVDNIDDPILNQIGFLLQNRSEEDRRTILKMVELACSLSCD